MKGEFPHLIPTWIPVKGFNNPDVGKADIDIYARKSRPTTSVNPRGRLVQRTDKPLPRHLDNLGTKRKWTRE